MISETTAGRRAGPRAGIAWAVAVLLAAGGCRTPGGVATPAAAPGPGSDPEALVAEGQARLGAGDLAGALARLDAAVALGDTPQARLARGRALGAAARFDEAARDLARATELAPERGDAWAALAAAQVGRGDDVRSDAAFAGAVARLGEREAVVRAWAELLFMPPDRDAPQESLDRCTRGHTALREGRFVDAQREAMNGLRYAPRFAWCVGVLGEATARLGDPTRGAELLRRSLPLFAERLAPLRADAKGRLARVLVDADGNAAEAARLAREALAERGERAAVLEVLARACERTGDEACARDAWTRLARTPGLPDAWRERAEAALAARSPGATASATP